MVRASGKIIHAFNPTEHLNTTQTAASKGCDVLPLSLPDLAVAHRGTIQGQRPLLQNSRSGTLLRWRLFYRSTEQGQSGQVRYMRSQGNKIPYRGAGGRRLTVVRDLEGVLAFSSFTPAAHSGESPVLVTCWVSMYQIQRHDLIKTAVKLSFLYDYI